MADRPSASDREPANVPFTLSLPGLSPRHDTGDQTWRPQTPLVYASPHSGRFYPPAFVAQSKLSSHQLRMSEDSFIEELFAAAPEHGAPLIAANFARAYVDPNREAYELDPDMFVENLPAHVNRKSPRVAGGLGTIARIVHRGAEIYGKRLSFKEVEVRLRQAYFPYHEALAYLVQQSIQAFGVCFVVDCHSMPSNSQNADGGGKADIVLGDRYGASCSAELMNLAIDAIQHQGLSVVRNVPYAGGFTTSHYGRPDEGIHALQIEINRALYMDEQRLQKNGGFDRLSRALTQVIAQFAQIDPMALLPHPMAAQ